MLHCDGTVPDALRCGGLITSLKLCLSWHFLESLASCSYQVFHLCISFDMHTHAFHFKLCEPYLLSWPVLGPGFYHCLNKVVLSDDIFKPIFAQRPPKIPMLQYQLSICSLASKLGPP